MNDKNINKDLYIKWIQTPAGLRKPATLRELCRALNISGKQIDNYKSSPEYQQATKKEIK